MSRDFDREKRDNDARNAAYAAGMRRAVESGFDTVAWKCPDILKVTYPPPQYTPLCVSKESFAPECQPGYSEVSPGRCIYTGEPYAAEPPKGFFARYWLLIVVLVFVMLYLRRRKTARLV